MFYNRVDSEDDNLEQESANKLNPDVDKFFGHLFDGNFFFGFKSLL